MTKKGLQSTDAVNEQGSNGQKCTESLEGHLYEGETSHRSSGKSPMIESGMENVLSNIDLSTLNSQKGKMHDFLISLL